ncbi:MAG: DNA methyltransferase, partial [Bacteroidota bacterium]
MNSKQIETNVQQLLQTTDKDTFIYDFLLAYGAAKSTITRLRKGNMNLSKEDGVVSWKKKVLFKATDKEALHLMITELRAQAKHKQRFVIVTNFETLLAMDTKLEDTLDIPFTELARQYDFFLPLAGMEKAQIQDENPADVRAAERMAKLFDEIKKDNPDTSPEFLSGLNVFLSRLLFCFFAEDTHIFEDNQFTSAIESHTQQDGSDLGSFLHTLFEVLNTPNSTRTNLPAYLDAFPYVNGGLFREQLATPTFTARSRKAIVDSGSLDWAAINPDIFGSMFQSVIRGLDGDDNTKHYTSVPNIMKVIEPLFLNELKETFENAKGKRDKLNDLLKRLSNIKIFDPACGSGNFLIIAYKELRKLEIQIITELQTIEGNLGSGSLDFGSSYLSKISLAQFYGIELNTFAAEIAQLSL